MSQKRLSAQSRRASQLNVVIHYQNCGSEVQIQHDVMDTTGAPVSSLSTFAVYFLFRSAKEAGSLGNRVDNQLSYGIIQPVTDRVEFETKNMTFPLRRPISFPVCTLQQFYQLQNAIYLISLDQFCASQDESGVVCAYYQLAMAYGCSHVVTGCKVKCGECGGLYSCYECHHEAEMHQMNPQLIKTVCCARCGREYPFAAMCKFCGFHFGNYSCAICKINQFVSAHQIPLAHCAVCKTCHETISGRMESCAHCGKCYIRGRLHVCRNGECCVCLTSAEFGPYPYNTRCRHVLHYSCAQRLIIEQNFKCPICRCMFLDHVDQRAAFKRVVNKHRSFFLDYQVDYSYSLLKCYDCQAEFTRKSHPSNVYFCDCGSFNTELISETQTPPDTEAEGPVKYQYIDHETVCYFLVKRHGAEIEREYGISADNYFEVLSCIFKVLRISGSPLECAVVGIIYNDAIATLQDLQAYLRFFINLIDEVAEFS